MVFGSILGFPLSLAYSCSGSLPSSLSCLTFLSFIYDSYKNKLKALPTTYGVNSKLTVSINLGSFFYLSVNWSGFI